MDSYLSNPEQDKNKGQNKMCLCHFVHKLFS